MKKIIAIMFFIGMIMFQVSAQDSQPATPSAPDGVEIVNAVFAQTTAAIASLAETLKVPAEHVYSILVKQQFVSSVSSITIILFMLFAGWLFIKLSKDNYAEYKKDHESDRYGIDSFTEPDRWWIWSTIIGCILLLIGITAIFAEFTDIVTGFINPEYGALQDIIKIL